MGEYWNDADSCFPNWDTLNSNIYKGFFYLFFWLEPKEPKVQDFLEFP